MTTVIRAARRAELPAIFNLLELAFPEASRALFVAQTERDSTFRLRHGRVVLLDGEVAAYVRIFARTMLVGGRPLPAGGIGSVATHPGARGRGLASALMRDAIEQMRRERMQVSFLFTGIPRFYAPFGYRIIRQPYFDADPREAALAPHSGLYDVRGAEAGDVPRLLAIYRRAVAASTGAIARTRRTWRDATHWLTEDDDGCFVAERNGLPAAYLRSRCRAYGHEIIEAECLPGHEDAIIALLARVGGRAIEQGERIASTAPDDHQLTMALRLLPSTRESAPLHPMMVRALTDDPPIDAAFEREPLHYWNSDRI
jgi:predicted N-acetyltransferase YhbS